MNKSLKNKSLICLFPAICWLSGKRGSNSRPSAWEADALPTELLPQVKNKQPLLDVGDAKVCIIFGMTKRFFGIFQGWRMRFNSNSVKNSPDYVK